MAYAHLRIQQVKVNASLVTDDLRQLYIAIDQDREGVVAWLSAEGAQCTRLYYSCGLGTKIG